MTKKITAAALAALLSAGTAAAQGRGAGSGAPSDTAPVTKSAGVAPERAQLPIRDSQMMPRHGLLGSPGGAPDAYGGSRLGRRDLDAATGAEPGPQWTAGDRVRSLSSAEVRAARVQEAPDLEWGEAGPASARAGPAAPPPAPAKAAPATRPAKAKRSAK